eukprot:CAMPEP_0113511444 /NCGR_PEP_ID=MMETSP0014_2-20120614/38726_1 /TAXON_ID=2857 /ORGANISM="Nitzschia sp." /LENGTH=62 /DNA_ID=CAMNT_0000407569 /DNA_START=133 /DNA_END=317 /DNA_ORIENTATION=- /assembly_acc=CAM_ASM_000159
MIDEGQAMDVALKTKNDCMDRLRQMKNFGGGPIVTTDDLFKLCPLVKITSSLSILKDFNIDR